MKMANWRIFFPSGFLGFLFSIGAVVGPEQANQLEFSFPLLAPHFRPASPHSDPETPLELFGAETRDFAHSKYVPRFARNDGEDYHKNAS